MRQIVGNAINDSGARRSTSGKGEDLTARPVSIMLNLTPEELTVLTALAADQVFRKEFIDPKMPGHKANPEEILLAKALIGRMRTILYGPTPHNSRSTQSNNRK